MTFRNAQVQDSYLADPEVDLPAWNGEWKLRAKVFLDYDPALLLQQDGLESGELTDGAGVRGVAGLRSNFLNRRSFPPIL